MPGEIASIAFMTDKLPPGHDAERQDDTLPAFIERARAGEAAAFEQLMKCTERGVAATVWRMLGNREDARDAMQETYLRVYKYLKSYKAEQDFHGWLYRIAVNVCRDMLRARGAQAGAFTARLSSLESGEERPALESVASADDTEQAATLAQKRAIVERALQTLPEKERTAIVLRDLEGRSTEEVARLMNTRPATVRSQISTARTKLKLYCERLLCERRG
jgi:RNA polymerase sigma-70 factor (ECF subfamily)